MTPEKTELAPREEPTEKPLVPVASADELVAAMQRFAEIKRRLLSDEDLYTAKDNQTRIRKSGWRKLALAFNLSDEVLESSYMPNEALPGSWIYRVRVRVISRGGRSVQGVGAASTTERNFANPAHDCFALAHTRAKSRAIADMLGSSDQVAEELEEPEQPAPKAPTPTPPPASTPRTTSPLRDHAQQAAVVWDFLDKVLGEDLTAHVNIDTTGAEILVKLDRKLVEEYGNVFISRMMKWGYGVHETPEGIAARLARPKA